MGANDVGPVEHGDGRCGQGAVQAVRGIGAPEDFVKKGLAGDTHEDREPQGPEPAEVPDQGYVLGPSLRLHPAADAGIEDERDAVLREALAKARTLLERGQRRLHGERIPRNLFGGHDHGRASGSKGQLGHPRVGLEAAYVVDDPGAHLEGRLGHRAVDGVHRDRGVESPGDPGQGGLQAGDLLGGSDRLHPRRGGCGPDVYEFGPLLDHPLGRLEGPGPMSHRSLVEGFRAQVDDAHNPGGVGVAHGNAADRGLDHIIHQVRVSSAGEI